MATAMTVQAMPRSGVPASTNHHLPGGKGFRNPWDSFFVMPGWKFGYKMLKQRLQGKTKPPDMTGPKVAVKKPQFLPSRDTPQLRATWLGHASHYLEFTSGLRVLLDPVFTERCSPFTFLGPKRYTPLPCQIEDLPFLDAVVISHCHYDHLSYPTIMRVHKRFPDCHFFVPLGNKAWFNKCGIEKVTELDWWDSVTFKLDLSDEAHGASAAPPITCDLHCVPAQHMAARTPFDTNKTLWAGWTFESGGSKVYFAGDTAYRAMPDAECEDDHGDGREGYAHCPAFKEIGEQRGPFDLGLLPIGAYQPRNIMSTIHADPYDAVEIFKETRCEKAMGIHWGVWVLTDEELMEPPAMLRKALARSGIAEVGKFDTCDIGESRTFAKMTN